MHESSNGSSGSLVSIVLPTYNRAHFMPQAFASIRAQTFTQWELIVVDDGSTDDTRAVVEALAAAGPQPVRYVWQKNQGPAEARNTGIERACGKYLAFFDSDDLWLPHHVQDCFAALAANAEVGWVFSAGRRVDYQTKQVLIEHSFYGNTQRPRFLQLHTRRAGPLHIFDDSDLLWCALRGGGFGGLQTAMVRRDVFANLRFQTAAFFEDRLALIRAIAAGVRIGYLDNVHVVVHTHSTNISFASDKAIDSRVTAMRTYVEALEDLRKELPLKRRECRALNHKLGQEYFWHLGYWLVQQGRAKDALPFMRSGMRCWPCNPFFWKAYLSTRVKAAFWQAPALR